MSIGILQTAKIQFYETITAKVYQRQLNILMTELPFE